MKFIKYLPLLCLIFINQSYGLTIEEDTAIGYINLCKDAVYNEASPCYSYYQGVVDTLLVFNKRLCINGTNKQIYKKVISTASIILKGKENVYKYKFPSELIIRSFAQAFPCKNVFKINK